MKVYLDDDRENRPTPDGFRRVYTAQEAIDVLKTGKVTVISLDHDLGPREKCGDGTAVMKWIRDNKLRPLPEIYFHTQNPVGRVSMQNVLLDILTGRDGPPEIPLLTTE